MLAESIIRMGKVIAASNLSNKERIRLLTDVTSDSCKNYFQNVWIVETDGEQVTSYRKQVGEFQRDERNKEVFVVDSINSTSFPVFFPSGGNPLHAQGVYPVPCYLMYDPHIKGMATGNEWAQEVLLPRLKKTISYSSYTAEQLDNLAILIGTELSSKKDDYIVAAKQLGILIICDSRLADFSYADVSFRNADSLVVGESIMYSGKQIVLNEEQALSNILEARYTEAKELGVRTNAYSTFTNHLEAEVVSAYNKSWLWLSPTWEAPRSIYWSDKDWTDGIKIDRENYEAFLYGAQFMKQLQKPLVAPVLKEMFAPNNRVEAKKHMSYSSFQSIYGIPILLPLLDADLGQAYSKLQRIVRRGEAGNSSDLHMERLAGIKDTFVPGDAEEYRLTLLYYSGDLSRGDVHIRAMIEDVIPSVAWKVQKVIDTVSKGKVLRKIIENLGMDYEQERERQQYRIGYLPSLLANAYGPAYVWNTLQDVFHKRQITLGRIYRSTAEKLNECANKEQYWEMKRELVFYYAFAAFVQNYNQNILGNEEEVITMEDWQDYVQKYHDGTITEDDLKDPEELGFIIGMLTRQYSDSYYVKTKRELLKTRIMKFGSKLTPDMIWKSGLMRFEELAQQWDLKLAGNFRSVLAVVLYEFLQQRQTKKIDAYRDEFMTAFWSGYLMYQQTKKNKGEESDDQ